jgi:hypothetical protein
MGYNPPEIREEIKDTLFCLGVEYVYAKVQTPKGHTWLFILPDTNTRIQIWGAFSVTMNGKRIRNTYELKLALMDLYREKI